MIRILTFTRLLKRDSGKYINPTKLQQKLVKKHLAGKWDFNIYSWLLSIKELIFIVFRGCVHAKQAIVKKPTNLNPRRKWNVSHRSIETKFLNETKPSTFFHQNIKLRRLRSEVELETRIFKNGTGRFCRTVWPVEEDLLWKWFVLDRRAKQLLSTSVQFYLFSDRNFRKFCLMESILTPAHRVYSSSPSFAFLLESITVETEIA